MRKIDVIAIDGPSGAGKSSIAKILSEKTGYEYISTGAMYRLVGLLADEKKIFDKDKKLENLCKEIKDKIYFKNSRIYFNNKDFTEKVYENRVSMLASDISKKKVVRNYLGTLQREIGLKQKCVLEGRDIGTVIFPDAKYKFYLDASDEVRAERRCKELKEKGENVDYNKILLEIKQRDKNDSTREIAPLKQAEDAIYIDTSKMNLDEVVNKIIEIMEKINGN
jgi:cytidylate kinase